MRFLPFALAALGPAVSVLANGSHAGLSARNHHHNLAIRSSLTLTTRAAGKKCPKRSHKPKSSGKTATDDKKETNNFTGDDGGSSGNTSGLIRVKSATCGNAGAARTTSKLTGPMGSIDWLNCGIDRGGWKPPNVQIQDVIAVPLAEALKDPKSPFKACSKFLHLFEKHAGRNNLPPIMLASFALQESSCNPGTVGGGGEQGLMQITKDKCGRAPGGNCRDPNYNIGTAADFFRKTLNNNGGNVVAAVGQYNGWFPGLTIAKATAARKSNCCLCQNNLDYLHQFFNGWMLNKDAYANRLGKYFNLEVCRR